MHGSSGPIRKNEIESRLLRGLHVNATALAKEFLVSEDAIRRDLRAYHPRFNTNLKGFSSRLVSEVALLVLNPRFDYSATD
jgi:hypothetical protein